MPRVIIAEATNPILLSRHLSGLSKTLEECITIDLGDHSSWVKVGGHLPGCMNVKESVFAAVLTTFSSNNPGSSINPRLLTESKSDQRFQHECKRRQQAFEYNFKHACASTEVWQIMSKHYKAAKRHCSKFNQGGKRAVHFKQNFTLVNPFTSADLAGCV